MSYTLAADIGGTKCLFGLFDGEMCVHERRLASAEFVGLEEALAVFLAEVGHPAIGRACLALAGPIDDDGRAARLTNLPWRAEAAALERRFALPRVRLVNDFAAAALGAVKSGAEQRCVVQEGDYQAQAPRLVLGAGTGLGVAFVLPEGAGWRVIPGEAGHMAFAPADAEQAALWQALNRQFGRVTWERVVSGPGLELLHRHLGGSALDAAAIAAAALAREDSLEAKVLTLFLACYGAVAGDLALAVLARGGVLLAGGIAAKVLPALTAGGFLAAFNAKAEHAHLACRMPVAVCLDERLGLHGARHFAAGTS